jgi:anti-repressor protein
MDNLMSFKFDSKEIRVLISSGEPWFVGKDIANALEYIDSHNAIKAHCRLVKPLKELAPGKTPRGLLENERLIPEADVYRLAVRSKSPSVERFEKWVTLDVFPSIRKTGRYLVRPSDQLSRLDILQITFESEQARPVRSGKVEEEKLH